MHFILKKDELTDGILTRLIEKTFYAESSGKRYNVLAIELIEIHKILKEYNNGEVFGEIAEKIEYPPENIANDNQGKLLLTYPQPKKRQIKLYNKQGFILYDGLSARASGHFSYFYRGEGVRIIWFEDGEIKVVDLYCQIDCNSTYAINEDIGQYDIFDRDSCKEEFSSISRYVGKEEFPSIDFDYRDYSDTYFWIDRLAKINMQFLRGYALEYLINPVDVQRLSDFSVELKFQLWESCLDLGKRIIGGKIEKSFIKLFKFFVNLLDMINIEPNSNQLNVFFEQILDNGDKIDLKNIINILKDSGLNNQPNEIENLDGNLDHIKPGKDDAYKYQGYIFRALKYIFYPYLNNGSCEKEINDGNMRVDIVFDNNSKEGFFYDLSIRHMIKCPFIMIECKNYEKDIKNPEFDQLSGRLTEKRGLFGILVCRTIKDKEKAIQKCKDIVNERKQYIIILCDTDINRLIALKNENKIEEINQYLKNKLKQILF